MTGLPAPRHCGCLMVEADCPSIRPPTNRDDVPYLAGDIELDNLQRPIRRKNAGDPDVAASAVANRDHRFLSEWYGDSPLAPASGWKDCGWVF